MPRLDCVPEVYSCCGIVNDLKTAAAIIAVIGIVSIVSKQSCYAQYSWVTSPAVSWAVVRHSYIIHVACYVGASSERPDILDLTFSNVISFGFGMNAGLGTSCLTRNVTTTQELFAFSSIVDGRTNSSLFKFVKGLGWAVFTFDLIFVITGIYFFFGIFKNPCRCAALVYMITSFLSNLLSCIYGIVYVICCMALGGSFPLFELFFAIFDLALWCYFIIVVNSYRIDIKAKYPTTQASEAGGAPPQSNFR